MGTRVGENFGKYKITRLLGKGGMGEVYEAVDTSKERTVALKILSDQYSQDERFRERFQRESARRPSCRSPTSSRSTTGVRLTITSTST